MTSTVALGEVATIEREIVSADEIVDGETYVGLENIVSGGSFSQVGTVVAGQLGSSKFRFDEEHVLYGKLRPYLAKIAAPSFAGVCSTDILPLRPGPQLDRRYLLHCLRTPEMVGLADRRSSGANLPRLSPKALEEFPIPLPPIEEQRRIAAVLDAADALRVKRREALAKLDTLTQAIFIDMFGTPQSNVRGLPEVELGELVQVKGGKRLPKGSDYADGPTDHPYIRVTDFKTGVVKLHDMRYLEPETQQSISRYTVSEGDVIVSIAGSIGEVASVPPELDGANLTENAAKLVRRDPESLCSDYLASFLRSDFAQGQITARTGQVTIGKLALFRIASLNILLPPMWQQRRYEQALRAVLAVRTRLQAGVMCSETLFASLQQRVFRGEL